MIHVNDIDAAQFRAVEVKGVVMEMAGQVALRFPVVGWLLRDAIYGRPEAKYYFLANCILAVALGAFIVGYAFVIVVAVAAAWVSLALIVYMTAADSFSKANRRQLAANKKRRPAV